jgi:hypothetical protein
VKIDIILRGSPVQGTFWSHTIWYLLLAAVSIFVTVVIFIRSDNRKYAIGFGLAVMGLTFFSETGLLTLSNAYRYMPKLSGDPFLDSIIGNYFSQFSITMSALLISTLQPPKIWYFIIAAAYCLVEILFIRLGIYQHHWYRTWYTFVLVLLLLWISQIWYRYMMHCPKTVIRYVTLFLGANAAFSITVIFFSYAFSLQVFHIAIFRNDYFRNQAVAIVSYRSIAILLMMILHGLKLRWWWKGGFLVVIFLLNYMLVRMGIQTFKDGLFWVVTLGNIIGSYCWVVVVDYWLKQGSVDMKRRPPYINPLP